jgi:hypothetical protein
MKYLINALSFFFIQLGLEILIIVSLLYLGLPYFDMKIGSESFNEIIMGIIGYYGFSKTIFFGWIYILLFVIISYLKKTNSIKPLSFLNAILNLLFIVIMLLKGKPIEWIISPTIASVIGSFIICIYSYIKTPYHKR